MSIFDDEPIKTNAAHVVGSDLSLLSVDELDQRIELLRAEIDRLTEEKERKASGKKAADALFKL